MRTNKEKYEEIWGQLEDRSRIFIKSVLPAIPKSFFAISTNYTKHKDGYFIEEYPIEKAAYHYGFYRTCHKRPTKKDIAELTAKIAGMPDFTPDNIMFYWRIDNTSGAGKMSDFSEGKKAWIVEKLQPRLQILIDTYSPKKGYIACSYCRKQRKPEDIVYKTIISPNWKNQGFKSPPRPYCKDNHCAVWDQMGHEG